MTRLAIVALLLLTRGLAPAHTRLVSSEPAKDARLTGSPRVIRLVFSGPVEGALSRITLVRADSTTISASVSGDPRDVNAIVGTVDGLAAGSYRVVWRIVAADGHPIEGNFIFHVERVAAADTTADTAAALPPPHLEHPGGEPATHGPSLAGADIIPAILRGIGIGTLMGATGLLLFVALTGAGLASRPARVAVWLTGGALLFLLGHLVAWILHVLPEHGREIGEFSHVLATKGGHVELIRIALAVLALWAIALARRVTLGLVFAAGAVVVSGAIGHSAGIQPEWAIPAKAIHLVGVSAWFGGLLWLLLRERDDAARYISEAGRMSSIALWAVIAVAFTGIVQVRLFLPSTAALVSSAYGAVTLAKIAGLLALVAFGAYHRKRVLPRLSDLSIAESFRGSLSREIAVMVAVILLGGFLGYVPPPTSIDQTVSALDVGR